MIEEIQEYLKRSCGIATAVHGNRSDLNLSPIVAALYDFWSCLANGTQFEIMALKPDAQQSPTPRQISVHAASVSRQMDGIPVVFASRRIVSYNRLRLVERRIPFIVPQKQIYLPFLNMALSDTQDQTVKEYDALGIPAQMLLIAYLNRPHDGIAIDEAAALIGYTRVSIMKAFDELEYFNFAHRDRRTHRLVFRTDRRTLFDDARRVMKNPRRRIVHLNELPQGLAVVDSGTCELARFSMLSPPDYHEVAALSSDYGKCEKPKIVPKDDARYRLELWHHPPAFLFKDRIDPLSLVLSLSQETDERVQGEIEDVLEAFKW